MLKESCNKHEAIMKCKELLGWKATTVESSQKTIWRILRKRMGQTEKAKSYLKARGLNHQGVGYNSGNWKGNYAQAAALCGVDAWGKNCVVYPLKNALGQVVSFYARSLTFGHFYQSGRAGLYPSYPSKAAKKVILTESIIDAY